LNKLDLANASQYVTDLQGTGWCGQIQVVAQTHGGAPPRAQLGERIYEVFKRPSKTVDFPNEYGIKPPLVGVGA
jgi:hypothetical protein